MTYYDEKYKFFSPTEGSVVKFRGDNSINIWNVISFALSDDKKHICAKELCDEHYFENLNKVEVNFIIEHLIKLRDQMEEE